MYGSTTDVAFLLFVFQTSEKKQTKLGSVLIVRDKYSFQESLCSFALPCLDTFRNTTELFLSRERRKQSLILFASNCQLTYQLRAKCYIYTFQNGLFTDAHLISLPCLLSEGSSYSSDCFLKKSVNPFSFNVGKASKGLCAFISKNRLLVHGCRVGKI